MVLPADRLDARGAEGPPLIAWGPAGLMRAAFLRGCADYLRDPWTPEELLLRAESVLAREAARFILPWATVSLRGDTLRTPRGPVALTHHQAVILRALLRRRGRPVARAALGSLLGGNTGAGSSRRVDAHVCAIRRLVRSVDPAAGRFIVCVRRRGYLIP